MPELDPSTINLLRPAIAAFDQQNGMLGFVHGHLKHVPAGISAEVATMLKDDVVGAYLTAAEMVVKQKRLGEFVENCGALAVGREIDRSSDLYKETARYAGAKLRDPEATQQLDIAIKHFGAPKNVAAFSKLYGKLLVPIAEGEAPTPAPKPVKRVAPAPRPAVTKPHVKPVVSEATIKQAVPQPKPAPQPAGPIIGRRVVLRTYGENAIPVAVQKRLDEVWAEKAQELAAQLAKYAQSKIEASGGEVLKSVLARRIVVKMQSAITYEEAVAAVDNLVAGEHIHAGIRREGMSTVSNTPIQGVKMRAEASSSNREQKDDRLTLEDRANTALVLSALETTQHRVTGLSIPELAAKSGIEEESLRIFVSKLVKNNVVVRELQKRKKSSQSQKVRIMRVLFKDQTAWNAYRKDSGLFLDSLFSAAESEAQNLVAPNEEE